MFVEDEGTSEAADDKCVRKSSKRSRSPDMGSVSDEGHLKKTARLMVSDEEDEQPVEKGTETG